MINDQIILFYIALPLIALAIFVLIMLFSFRRRK